MEARFGGGETWNNYYPVTAPTVGATNMINIRIPKANFICDLSRAFLRLETNLPYSINTDLHGLIDLVADDADRGLNTDKEDVNHRFHASLSNLNAACIFDTVEVVINGQAIYHNEHNQTAARLNSFNKSDEWLRAHPQTFINPLNTDCVFMNKQLTYRILQAQEDDYNAGTKLNEVKEVIIPLSLLFPCFETMNEWPSFVVNDTLQLNLRVSELYKYMVNMIPTTTDMKHYFVRPVPGGSYWKYDYVYPGEDAETHEPTILHTEVQFYPEEFTVSNINLYIPVHNPTTTERNRVSAMINSAVGMSINFRHWDVNNYVSKYMPDGISPQLNQQVNFNITTNNIFGIAMLAQQSGTEVVFEKPMISNIQLNLGPWEQASNGTHLYNNYQYGGDLLRSVLDNFSQSNLKYYQTINKQVIYDHAIGLVNANSGILYRPTGSYFTYFDVSPYDELGVSANEFSNIVTYKYSVTDSIVANSYLTSATTTCAVLTLSTLTINATGVTIFNPDSRHLTTEALNALGDPDAGKYTFRGPHGIPPQLIGAAVGAIPKVISTVVGLARKVKDGIKGLIMKIRDHRSRRHMEWMADRLTEEEMQANYNKLLADSYRILPVRWKKTFNKIIAARGEAPHGALFMRHGIFDATYSVIKPGFRMNPLHDLRIRFGPYGRFLHLLRHRIIPKAAHGLGSLFHSFTRFLSPVVKRVTQVITRKVPSIFRPAFETGQSMVGSGREIIQAFLDGKISAEEAKTAALANLKAGGKDIMQQLLTEIARRGNQGIQRLFTRHHGIPDRRRILFNYLAKNGRIDWDMLKADPMVRAKWLRIPYIDPTLPPAIQTYA